jgi:hypothetical protein
MSLITAAGRADTADCTGLLAALMLDLSADGFVPPDVVDEVALPADTGGVDHTAERVLMPMGPEVLPGAGDVQRKKTRPACVTA